MSVNEQEGRAAHLEELPEFDLEYMFDDDDNPEEVTVYSDEPEYLSTRWVTAAVGDCTPLEECR